MRKSIWRAFVLVYRSAPRLFVLSISIDILTGVIGGAQLLVARFALGKMLLPHLAGLSAGLAGALGALALMVAFGSFLSLASADLREPLFERVHRHSMDRVIDAACAVDLATFDDPTFHDRLRRAQYAAGSSPYMIVMALTNLLGAAAGAVAILIVLATVSPILTLFAMLLPIPLWFSASRRGKTRYLVASAMASPERMRRYLETTLVSTGAAQEIRAFDLTRFLRSRYDSLWSLRQEKTDAAVVKDPSQLIVN